MFYISKITPFFFILGIIDLLIGLILKITGTDYIHYGFVLVLGFIASTILGAMYQIIPNSQQEKLPYPQVSYIVFGLSVLLSLFLILKNYKSASIVFFALIVLFSIHLSLIIKNVKPVTIRFLTASLFYITLSSIIFIASAFGTVPLQAVIHTFTVGAMINAVFGVEFAWIPMFYMQTVDFKKGNLIFVLSQIATIFILLSFVIFNYNLILTAVLFELLTVVFFIALMISVIKKGKALIGIPYSVKFFITGLSFLLGGLITAVFITLLKNPVFIEIHIDFMVFGFGVFTIAGGMLHLTPRILWNMVYIKKAQQGKQIPQVNMVIPKDKAEMFFKSLFISFLLGIIFEGIGFIYIWFIFWAILATFWIYFSYKLIMFIKN